MSHRTDDEGRVAQRLVARSGLSHFVRVSTTVQGTIRQATEQRIAAGTSHERDRSRHSRRIERVVPRSRINRRHCRCTGEREGVGASSTQQRLHIEDVECAGRRVVDRTTRGRNPRGIRVATLEGITTCCATANNRFDVCEAGRVRGRRAAEARR